MFLQQMKKCQDIESLHEFCQALDSLTVQFNGKSYVNLETGDTLNAVQLTNRIIDLYNKFSMKKGLETKTAEEVSALLFDLEAITKKQSVSEQVFNKIFGNKSTLNNLAKHCQDAVRKDEKVMETVIKNYNLLASEVNDGIRRKTFAASAPDKEILSQELKKLEFLNEFLGLQWNSRQHKGMQPLPLCGTEKIFEAPAPASQQPHDCENLAELYGLVQSLRKEITISEGGERIKIPGKATISVNEFEEKLLELFNKEIARDPYIKRDLYIQFAAIGFNLEKLIQRPTGQRNAELQRAFQTCIAEIRNDPEAMSRIKRQYNALVGRINEGFHHGVVRDSATWSGLSHKRNWLHNREQGLKTMENIMFLNLFVDFKLEHDHFEGKAFFPKSFDVNKPDELKAVQDEYNFLAIMINYELGCASRHDRLAELKRQIDPENLTSLMLDEVERAAINEEIGQLESYIELTAPPLPKKFIVNLRKEACRLADLQGISLTTEQRKGLEPLPLLGREIPLEKDPRSFTIVEPYRLKQYNITAGQINAQMDYIDKGLDYLELLRKFNEMDFGASFVEIDEVHPVLKQLEKEWKQDRDTDEYFFWESDRMAQSRLANLLIYVDRYDLVTLTDRQKQGREPLPIIDIDNIPFPGRDVMEKELGQIDRSKWTLLYDSWPESWKVHLPKTTEVEPSTSS